MGRRQHSFRIPTLGLPEQKARLRHVWPNLECDIAGPVLTCRGRIQPLAIGRSYLVRVVYQLKRWPCAYVDDPPLRRREEEPDVPIRHTYNSKKPGRERPCLFVPDSKSWRSDKALAYTVIPWLLEWLSHYEIWHATGEWYGGGVHPSGSEEE